MPNSTHTYSSHTRRTRPTLGKRVRQYFQKHLVPILLIGILVIGMMVGIFIGSKVTAYAQSMTISDYGRQQAYVTYTVQRGDTIWQIAADLAALNPEYNSIRHYVAEIERVNRIYTGYIEAGDEILIPYFVNVDGTLSHDELYAKYGIGEE